MPCSSTCIESSCTASSVTPLTVPPRCSASKSALKRSRVSFTASNATGRPCSASVELLESRCDSICISVAVAVDAAAWAAVRTSNHMMSAANMRKVTSRMPRTWNCRAIGRWPISGTFPGILTLASTFESAPAATPTPVDRNPGRRRRLDVQRGQIDVRRTAGPGSPASGFRRFIANAMVPPHDAPGHAPVRTIDATPRRAAIVPRAERSRSAASLARSNSCHAPPSGSAQRWPYQAGASGSAATRREIGNVAEAEHALHHHADIHVARRGPNRISRLCPLVPCGTTVSRPRNPARSTTL